MAVIEQIEKVPLKQRAILLILLLGLIGGGFAYGVYMPKSKQIASRRAQLVTLEGEVATLRKIESENLKFEQRIKELTTQLLAARQQLPGEKEIPKILEEIARFGKESGIDFISFRPGAEVLRDFYNDVPMSLAIRGPFHNIGTFLDKISHYSRIISVSNLAMGAPVEKEGYLMLTSTCIATTYRYVENK